MRLAIVEENVIIREGLVATVVSFDGVELGFVGDHLGALVHSEWGDVTHLLVDLRNDEAAVDTYVGLEVVSIVRAARRGNLPLTVIGFSGFARDPVVRLRAWESGVDFLYSKIDVTKPSAVYAMLFRPAPAASVVEPAAREIDPDLRLTPRLNRLVQLIRVDPLVRKVIFGYEQSRGRAYRIRQRIAEEARIVVPDGSHLLRQDLLRDLARRALGHRTSHDNPTELDPPTTGP